MIWSLTWNSTQCDLEWLLQAMNYRFYTVIRIVDLTNQRRIPPSQNPKFHDEIIGPFEGQGVFFESDV